MKKTGPKPRQPLVATAVTKTPAAKSPTTTSKATAVAFNSIIQIHRRNFRLHPLGPPNTNSSCFQVQTNKGKALFAIGRYSQYADPNIISITRMLYPDQHASHFLAVFRKYLRHNTSYRAVSTWTDPAHIGTHLQADGWVYVANHNQRKRWVRTL